MSDNEDLLGDDLIDHGISDETYNLGNEEEDLLLADHDDHYINESIQVRHHVTKQISTDVTSNAPQVHSEPILKKEHVEPKQLHVDSKLPEVKKVVETPSKPQQVDQKPQNVVQTPQNVAQKPVEVLPKVQEIIPKPQVVKSVPKEVVPPKTPIVIKNTPDVSLKQPLISQKPQVVNQRSPVANQAPQFVNQRPQIVNQRPQIPNQRPQAPIQRPQIPNQRPQISNQRPQIPNQRPQTPNQRPQTPIQRPQTPIQRPQIPNQRPQTPNQRSQTPQRPQIPNQRPQAPIQRPQAPNQRPQIPNQRPQIPNQTPQIVNQRPQVANQRPQIFNQRPQLVNQRPQIVPQIANPRPQMVNQKPQEEPRSQNSNQKPYEVQVAPTPKPQVVQTPVEPAKAPEVIQPTILPPHHRKSSESAEDFDQNRSLEESLEQEAARSRYRDGHRDRFPTERSDSQGLSGHNIPDTLDSVVTREVPKQQFRNRRQQMRDRRNNQDINSGHPDNAQQNQRHPFQQDARGPPMHPYHQPNRNFNPYSEGPPGDYRNPPFNEYRPDNNMMMPQNFNHFNRPPPMPNSFRPPMMASGPPRHMMGGPMEPRMRPPLLNDPHLPPFVPPQFRPAAPMEQPPPRMEGKKVLINPNFKGPVPSLDVLMQQQHQQPPLHGEGSGAPPGFPPRSDRYRGGPPPYGPMDPVAPIDEKVLERLTEQFIAEQKDFLQKNEYFNKTQRFIESTHIEARKPKVDPEVERLNRIQEEFIQANKLGMLRRRNSPKESRKRHRTPSPPPARPVEDRVGSWDPEEREYHNRLREQADMRARVLQAKERRRRQNTTSVEEKKRPVSPQNKSDRPPPKAQPAQPTAEKKLAPPPAKRASNPAADTTANKQQNSQQAVKKNSPQKSDNPEDDDDEDPVMKKIIDGDFDDILDDDALRLSPEDEDLLLSDGERDGNTPPLRNSVTSISTQKENVSKVKKSPVQQKQPVKEIMLTSKTTSSKQIAGAKRPAEPRQDLRTKLARPAPPAEQPAVPAQQQQQSPPESQTIHATNSSGSSMTASSGTVTAASPRRKIVFGDSQPPSADNQEGKDKVDATKDASTNKWRSTFTEQKLERTAPIAARAISAVLRTATGETRKPNPPSKAEPKPEQDKSGGLFGGRRVLVGKTNNNRVVLPRRPRPAIVIVEKEEPEPYEDEEELEKKGEGRTALVGGLPPGMTEARLLSLCGTQVENVIVSGGAAKATFVNREAAQRFVRRFNGRLVAACCLKVTLDE